LIAAACVDGLVAQPWHKSNAVIADSSLFKIVLPNIV
jgi:hypothetical protein